MKDSYLITSPEGDLYVIDAIATKSKRIEITRTSQAYTPNTTVSETYISWFDCIPIEEKAAYDFLIGNDKDIYVIRKQGTGDGKIDIFVLVYDSYTDDKHTPYTGYNRKDGKIAHIITPLNKVDQKDLAYYTFQISRKTDDIYVFEHRIGQKLIYNILNKINVDPQQADKQYASSKGPYTIEYAFQANEKLILHGVDIEKILTYQTQIRTEDDNVIRIIPLLEGPGHGVEIRSLRLKSLPITVNSLMSGSGENLIVDMQTDQSDFRNIRLFTPESSIIRYWVEGFSISFSLKELQNLNKNMKNLSLNYSFKIAGYSEKKFVDLVTKKENIMRENSARYYYQMALARSNIVLNRYINEYQTRSPFLNNLAFSSLSNDDKDSHRAMFKKLNYLVSDEANTIYSPAAYFYELMRIIHSGEYIKSTDEKYNLENRRPDLFEIPFDQIHTFDTVPYLQVVNNVLARKYLSLQGSKFPEDLRFDEMNTWTENESVRVLSKNNKTAWFRPLRNLAIEQARNYLDNLGVTLFDVFSAMANQGAGCTVLAHLVEDQTKLQNLRHNLSIEYLGFSQEELDWLLKVSNSDRNTNYDEGLLEDLKQQGINLKPSDNQYFSLELGKFLQITKLSKDSLLKLVPYKETVTQKELRYFQSLFFNSPSQNDIVLLSLKLPEANNEDIETPAEMVTNLSLERLQKIAIFTYLSEKLGLEYGDLQLVLSAMGMNELSSINNSFMTESNITKLAKIMWLIRICKATAFEASIFVSDLNTASLENVYLNSKDKGVDKYLRMIFTESSLEEAWSSILITCGIDVNQFISSIAKQFNITPQSIRILLMNTNNKLNMKDLLNRIFRTVILTKLCQCSVFDLIRLSLIVPNSGISIDKVSIIDNLIAVSEINNLKSFDIIFDLYEARSWLKSNSIDIDSVLRVILEDTNDFDDQKNKNAMLIFLQNLSDQLKLSSHENGNADADVKYNVLYSIACHETANYLKIDEVIVKQIIEYLSEKRYPSIQKEISNITNNIDEASNFTVSDDQITINVPTEADLQRILSIIRVFEKYQLMFFQHNEAIFFENMLPDLVFKLRSDIKKLLINVSYPNNEIINKALTDIIAINDKPNFTIDSLNKYYDSLVSMTKIIGSTDVDKSINNIMAYFYIYLNQIVSGIYVKIKNQYIDIDESLTSSKISRDKLKLYDDFNTHFGEYKSKRALCLLFDLDPDKGAISIDLKKISIRNLVIINKLAILVKLFNLSSIDNILPMNKSSLEVLLDEISIKPLEDKAIFADVNKLNNDNNKDSVKIIPIHAIITYSNIRNLYEILKLQKIFDKSDNTMLNSITKIDDNGSVVDNKTQILDNKDDSLLAKIKNVCFFLSEQKNSNLSIKSVLLITQLYEICKKINNNEFILTYLSNILFKASSEVGVDNINDLLSELKKELSSISIEKFNTANRIIAEQLRDVLLENVLAEFSYQNVGDTTTKDRVKISKSELSEYLLLDLEMSGCMDTSYIVQGIASLQMYLQRCRLGIESGVVSTITDKMWSVIEYYRVWEANRKILLYPENYIEPELRKPQSREFSELAQKLLQSNLGNDQINEIIGEYIHSIKSLGQLVYIDAIVTNDNKKIYLFARTNSAPYRFCFRIVDSPENSDYSKISSHQWSFWTEIKVNIHSDNLTAVFSKGRLYIFWVENNYKTVNYQTKDDADLANNHDIPKIPHEELHYKLLYSYMHSNQTWEVPQEICQGVARMNGSWSDFFYNKRNIEIDKKNYSNLEIKYVRHGNHHYIQQIKASDVKDSLYDLTFDMTDAILNRVCVSDIGGVLQIQYPHILYDNLYISSEVSAMQKHLTKNLCNPRIFTLNEQNIITETQYTPKVSVSLEDKNSDIISFDETKMPNFNYYRDGESGYIFLSKTIASTRFYLSPGDSSHFDISDHSNLLNFDKSRSCAVLDTKKEVYFVFNQGDNKTTKLAQISATWQMQTLEYKFFLSKYPGFFDEKLNILNQEDDIGIVVDKRTILTGPYPNQKEFNFDGAFGEYYWELFFHIPFYIANQFHAQQKFKEAREWYHYIFNPSKQHGKFIFTPFKKDTKYTFDDVDRILVDELTHMDEYTFDPHAIARKRIIAYKKAVVMRYIKNVMDWADSLYIENTRESIYEAFNLYLLAQDLLGQKPQPMGFNDPKITIAFQDHFTMSVNSVVLAILERYEDGMRKNDNTLTLKSITKIPVFNLLFSIPENKEFMSYWDMISDNLFKMRHCMNYQGVRQDLALFSPEIDPHQLVRAAANGNSIDIKFLLPQIFPIYRFEYLLSVVKEFVSQLIQTGNSLQNALERCDTESLMLLTNRQQSKLLDMVLSMKQDQVDIANTSVEQLTTTLQGATNRRTYFQKLLDNGLSKEENSARDTRIASQALSIVAMTLQNAASGAAIVPQFITGGAGAFSSPVALISAGGQNISSSLTIASAGLSQYASILSFVAEDLIQEAAYERREEDWQQQYEDADNNCQQIAYQLQVAQLQAKISQAEYYQYQAQVKQSDELSQYYQSKFTNMELYRWMVQQLMGFYKQYYDMALQLAKSLELAYQLEIPQTKKLFISTNHFSFLRKGLLAGESLMLEVNKMHKSYIEEHCRMFEIEKTISLKVLCEKIKNHKTWENYLKDINSPQGLEIKLEESDFNDDFNNHKFRRIKTISVTVPAISKPYQNINLVLTLKSHQVESGSVLTAGPMSGTNEVVISTGVNDTGYFESSLDSRYLPFEGKGAISTWILKVGKTNSLDKDTLNSIPDIILTLRYTAVNTNTYNDRPSM